MDHFQRLLEEAYLNHAYLIKHKLKDCDMIKKFMTSGSLTRDKETEEDLGGRGITPFLREHVVMTVYDGCPTSGLRCMSNLSPGTQLTAVRNLRTQEL
jgi:hypothetical protein